MEIPDYISISLLKSRTVCTRESSSYIILLQSFKSSVKSKWLISSRDSPNLYAVFISLSSIVKIIKVVTKKISDKVSPWKMPLFSFTSANVSPPEVNSTFQFFIDFSITLLVLLTTLKIFRHYRMQVWGTMSGFRIVSLGNTQVCHSSLAVFHCHFIYH